MTQSDYEKLNFKIDQSMIEFRTLTNAMLASIENRFKPRIQIRYYLMCFLKWLTLIIALPFVPIAVIACCPVILFLLINDHVENNRNRYFDDINYRVAELNKTMAKRIIKIEALKERRTKRLTELDISEIDESGKSENQ